MDVIEISPPKHLSFEIPNDLHRKLTLTNLTLRSVYIKIIQSHEIQLSLSHKSFLMDAFQQLKLDITVNWSQSARNLSCGKLRVYIWEIEQCVDEKEIERKMMSDKEHVLYEDITIEMLLNHKFLNFLHYSLKSEEQSPYQEMKSLTKYFLLKKVYPQDSSPTIIKIIREESFRTKLFAFVENLGHVKSINLINQQQTYLVQYTNINYDLCQFYSEWVNHQLIAFAIARVIEGADTSTTPNLINIDIPEGGVELKQMQCNPFNSISNPSQKSNPPSQKNIISSNFDNLKESSEMKRNIFKSNIEAYDTEDSVENQVKSKLELNKKSNTKSTAKQSFVNNNQSHERGRFRKRNKSEEMVIASISEEEQDEETIMKEMKEQLRSYRNATNFQTKVVEKVKIKRIEQKETVLDMNQKVLNIYIDTKDFQTFVYVLLRDCIKGFILEDIEVKKTLKFDPIDQQNIKKQAPIDMYKNQLLIFGNQSYLFYVNVQNGNNEWKYVQRKQIYSVAVLEELSLVAIGGKNFSKLAYLGKQTSRSNIKFYSCNPSDSHDHLFTYDIPGNSTGNVMAMHYITTSPNHMKLLLVHTMNNKNDSMIHFFRVKAYNQIEVYGQIEVDQIGILHLLKIKYNKEANRIVCMESIGDGEQEMDCYKKLKVKSQYEKVEVYTESIKTPLKRYISYHMGGKQGKYIQSHNQTKQWMTLVSDKGLDVYLYDFETGATHTLSQEKTEIKQAFLLRNGRFFITTSETILKIRQSKEIQENAEEK